MSRESGNAEKKPWRNYPVARHLRALRVEQGQGKSGRLDGRRVGRVRKESGRAAFGPPGRQIIASD